MAWNEVGEMAAVRDRAKMALAAPIGLMSPLWFAYGAAASAGAAWWLMMRWTPPGLLPINVEARFGSQETEAPTPSVPATLPPAAPSASVPVVMPQPMVAIVEPLLAKAAPESPPVIASPARAQAEGNETGAAGEVDAVDKGEADALADETGIVTADALPDNTPADDFSRLSGVGPKIAQALAKRGMTRFSQLAAWTPEDLAAFDAELKLNGRGIRADFIGQARRLLQSDV